MKATITKEDLQKQIDGCYSVINRQQEKIAKLQKKLDEIKKAEILDAIVKSGKSLEEILAFVQE